MSATDSTSEKGEISSKIAGNSNQATDGKESPLTYARKKIFVKHIWGKFQKRRWIVFSLFLTLFYVLPWLRMDGRPPFLLDIGERKFHLLGITLWPQDIYLLTLTLITAAVGLFFSTGLIGRVWCGYLCPQTVFTSVFIEIERFILGDSIKQIKLSKKPWTQSKIAKYTLRNLIWALIAFSAGFTFLAYFIPTDEIIKSISSGNLVGWPLFWIVLISLISFFDFGFFREQTCFIPCPYGRFQGALQDPNSLVVTYDKVKGEGNKEKNIKPACINCNYCVIVCPTGIDIRNGSQFECISCARCIDACAVVQVKQKRSPDLIRYESENALNGFRTKIIRPRMIIYSLILLIAVSFISYMLITRTGFDIQVTRNRNLLYIPLPGGKTSNMYYIKIMNMSNDDQSYYLGVKGIEAEIVSEKNPVNVKAGEIHDSSVSLTVYDKTLAGKITNFSFSLSRIDPKGKGKTVEQKSTFFIPEFDNEKEKSEHDKEE